MNNKKSFFIVAITILGIGLSAFAATKLWPGINADHKEQMLPNACEEYQRLVTNLMTQDDGLFVQGNINLYDAGQTGEQPEEIVPFSYMRQGKMLSATLGPLTTLSNGSIVLQIDTVNKYIALAEAQNGLEQFVTNSMMPIDKLLRDTSAFKFQLELSGLGANRMLSVRDEAMPEIKEWRIIYDTASYIIQKSEIDWRKGAAITGGKSDDKLWTTAISYHFLKPRRFNPEEEMKKIIMVKDNIVQPAESYSNYQLHTSH